MNRRNLWIVVVGILCLSLIALIRTTYAAPAELINVAFVDASPIYATGSSTGSIGVTIVPIATDIADETKLVISFATGIFTGDHNLFATTKTGQKLRIKGTGVSMGTDMHKVTTYLCTVPTSSDQIARIILEPKAED